MKDSGKILEKIPDKKEGNRSSRIRKGDFSKPSVSLADHVMYLQRTIGNLEVNRLIKSGALQTKLRIGQPGDKYEQEAERVAEHVMRMPEPCEIQRKSEEDLSEAKRDLRSTHEATPELEANFNALSGGGQPLPESVRSFFEPRFGYDFSHVRIHTDAKAAESAHAFNAQAYTVGQDIAFGEGKYVPDTLAGKQLVAHELTHVIQQRGESTLNVFKTLQMNPENEITFPPENITVTASEKKKILEKAGWKQRSIITTLVNFKGEPLSGYNVYGEIKVPDGENYYAGEVTGGAIIWSDAWVKPYGTIRLMAVSLGEPKPVISGVTQIQLPDKGPIRLEAVQDNTEVTVTATSSEEAATKAGAKGTVGIEFEVIKLGGEVSKEEEQKKGMSKAITWKVTMGTPAFKVKQIM